MRAYATVAWYEQFRHGVYVFMRRGTGETGWWHDCTPGDYGGNPMDFDSDAGCFVCRTCGDQFTNSEARKARETSGDSGA